MEARLIILTSRQNFTWISMEEIISWIEESWSTWAQQRKVPYKIINVDETEFTAFVRDAVSSDMIVVTCFNTAIASFLVGLREKLSLTTPWVFYLHGLASFGCWPLFHWKMGQLMTTRDIFIGSCSRDPDQLSLVFENATTRVIPFGLSEEKEIPLKSSSPVRKFAFLGRLSSQKNLHTLLISLGMLKEQGDTHWELHVFGAEDNYGSPLMGRRDLHYGSYLKDLVQKCGLSENITFHGFIKRDEIAALMEKEQWIFVSPSIHADENFGMAAYRSLLNGHQAVLSDWGGHSDFPPHFLGQVKLVNVYQSEIGPFIDVNELADTLREALKNKAEISPTFPPYYSRSRIFEKYDEIRETQTDLLSGPLLVRPLLHEILKRREDYLARGGEGSRIFEDYADPLAQVFFSAYGQRPQSRQRPQSLKLLPWVEDDNKGFIVKDPHRGAFQLSDEDDLFKYGLSYGE